METAALCFQGAGRIYGRLSKCSLLFPARWLCRLRLFLFFPSPRTHAAAPLPWQWVCISLWGWLEGCADKPNPQQILQLRPISSVSSKGEVGTAAEVGKRRRGYGKSAWLADVKRNGIFICGSPAPCKRKRWGFFCGKPAVSVRSQVMGGDAGHGSRVGQPWHVPPPCPWFTCA